MTFRLRIAPSPTGYPHIGTIYQALFNYAYAKKNGGKFIVRIEDTDRERFVEGAEEVIFEALDWFGLTEDESPRKGGQFGPYRQSERLPIYQKYAQVLIDAGHAEFAYYPKKEAGEKKDYSKKESEPFEISFKDNVVVPPKPTSVAEMLGDPMHFGDWVVRMMIPRDQKITVDDKIRGKIEFDTNQISQQVLIKSDGYPTYHLAVVVDDHLMEISQIVRAEEWISSFPKHQLLFEYFKWQMPAVYHTATLRNPDKSKLSKRHGHTNVTWYKELGFLPEAILNFLALLGWSHPEEKEIFNLEEFIKLFDLQDVRPVPPIFDLTKLEWMNGVYIREKSNDELKSLIHDFYKKDRVIIQLLADDSSNAILDLAKTRMNTLADFRLLVTKTPFTEKDFETAVRFTLVKALGALTPDIWKKERIFEIMKIIMEEHKIKMPVLYKIFTGQPHGLPLPDFMEALGKETTLERLGK